MGVSARLLGVALASGLLLASCSGDSSMKVPIVLRIAKTIPSDSGAEYDDYSRMRSVLKELVEQLQDVDKSIHVQIALYGRRNFVK